MTKGYVETSVTKCLILGAAGVGKTHLKHLLLKKDHPKQRVSTVSVQDWLTTLLEPSPSHWLVWVDKRKMTGLWLKMTRH